MTARDFLIDTLETCVSDPSGNGKRDLYISMCVIDTTIHSCSLEEFLHMVGNLEDIIESLYVCIAIR